MAIRDILVFLDDSTTNSDRVNAAYVLSEKYWANITGVSLQTMKPDHAKSANQQAILRMAKKLADNLVEEFTREALDRGQIVKTIIITGDSLTSALKMAHYARYYDLVIY